MQANGNLVLYTLLSSVWTSLWATNTTGNANAYLSVSWYGNLVVYSQTNEILWTSGTYTNGVKAPNKLFVDDLGYAYFVNSDGTVLWQTNNFGGTINVPSPTRAPVIPTVNPSFAPTSEPTAMPTSDKSPECAYFTSGEYDFKPLVMHRCHKMDSFEWISFSCNDTLDGINKYSYSDANCLTVTNVTTVSDVYHYKCGSDNLYLGSACRYTKLSEYSNCTTNSTHDIGIGEAQIKYLAMDQCAHGKYFINFGKAQNYSYEVLTCINPSATPSPGYGAIAFYDDKCEFSTGASQPFYNQCGSGVVENRRRLLSNDVSYQLEQECVLPWKIASNTASGFVFKQDEFMYFTNQCIRNSVNSSFLYKCDTASIVKNVYKDSICGFLNYSSTVIDYEYATCGGGMALFGTADWSGFSTCANSTYNEDIYGRTMTDICVANDKLGVSEKWECTRDQLIHISYGDDSCSTEVRKFTYQRGQCVNGKIINVHYCSSDPTTKAPTSEPTNDPTPAPSPAPTATPPFFLFPVNNDVFCPWVNHGGDSHTMEVVGSCHKFEGTKSYKWECIDEFTIKYSNYSDTECVTPAGSYSVFDSPPSRRRMYDYDYDYYTGPGKGDGSPPTWKVGNDPDGLPVSFDCTYFRLYNETNCNHARISASNGCDGNNVDASTESTFMDVTGICMVSSDGRFSVKSICNGTKYVSMEYDDTSCQSVDDNDTFSEGCVTFHNASFGLDFTCIAADYIPVDPMNSISMNSEVQCSWVYDFSWQLVLAADESICRVKGGDTSIKDICTGYGTMERRVFTNSNCSGPYSVTTLDNGQCQGCGPGRNKNGGSEWFDCSNYDQYADASGCDLVNVIGGDICDINGNPVLGGDNSNSIMVIRDVCVRTGLQSYRISSCNDTGATWYSYDDPKCTDLYQADRLENTCSDDNSPQKAICIDRVTAMPTDEPSSDPSPAPTMSPSAAPSVAPTVGYKPVDAVLCSYYFQEVPSIRRRLTTIIEEAPEAPPLVLIPPPTEVDEDYWLRAIGVCEQGAGSTSSKMICKGNNLYRQFYSTADCSGSFDSEMQSDAVYYDCNYITSCDTFQYEEFTDCTDTNELIASGDYIMDVCMTNNDDSFIATCSNEPHFVEILFYDGTDCQGNVVNNQSIEIAKCNALTGQYYEGTCLLNEDETTSTPAPIPAGINVTFDWQKPTETVTFIADPYASFVVRLYLTISDDDGILLNINDILDCDDCLKWQIKDYCDGQNAEWNDVEIDDFISDSIQFINVPYGDNNDMISSEMKIVRIRNEQNGYCYDEDLALNHIFQQDCSYGFRLTVDIPHKNDADTTYSTESSIKYTETNRLPHMGTCQIANISSLFPLDPFELDCSGWMGDSDTFTYNGILNGVLMQKDFISDPSMLEGITPSGSVKITVLIRDESNAISCFAINETFRSISEVLADDSNDLTVNEVTDSIDDIIDSTDFGDDPSTAVSVYSVADELSASGDIDKDEGKAIVTDIVSNIAETSSILSTNQSDDAPPPKASDILSTTATLTTLCSNPDIVDTSEGGGGGQIIELIPNVFSSIETFADNEENAADDLGSMAQQTLDLFFNLEQAIDSNVDDDEIDAATVEKNNEFIQTLSDYDTYACSLALSEAAEGEIFTYTKTQYNDDGSIKSKKESGGVKASTKNWNPLKPPKLLIGNQGITMPSDYGENNDGDFDCTISSTSTSKFRPSDKGYKSKSGVVTVNIYESSSGRRRLQSRENLDYNASECFPFFIAIDVQNQSVVDVANDNAFGLGELSLFPSCRYWNGSVASWDPDGCFVYNITNVTVVCACTHLTSFQITAEEFVPEANILTIRELRDVNGYNLARHPTVWIVILILLIFFGVLCLLNPNKGNEGRSIVAYEDIIYSDLRKDKMKSNTLTGKQLQAISEYMPNGDKVGKGMKAMSEGKQKEMCTMHYHLFRLQLRNDHTLLSVFQRTAGTNLSTRARLSCFFMYLTTIMVATSIFYGIEQQSEFGDITASFIISLISTLPVFIIKKLFINAKPTIIKSETEEVFTPRSPFDNVAATEEDESVSADGKERRDTQHSQRDTTKFNYATQTTRGTMLATLKKSETVTNALDIVQKDKMDTTINSINNALKNAQQNKSRSDRIALVEQVRMTIFNEIYPLPRYVKKIAWALLIIWTTICAYFAIAYGLQFDLLYQERQKWLGDCWGNFKQLVVENDLSEQQVAELQASLNPARSDNFPGANTSSAAWLISLLQSLLTSIFIWQPLTCYVVTWLKLWMFTYNVRMGLGPPKIIKFFKRCCGCWSPLDEYKDIEKNLSTSVVAHHSRPLDLIGFLGTDALFLERKLETKKEENGKNAAGDGDNMEVELAQIDDIGNDHALLDGMEEGQSALITGMVTKGSPSEEYDNGNNDDAGSDKEENALLEKEKESKQAYQPSDDPNSLGQQIPETELEENASSRLNIDEIAEHYFSDETNDEIHDETNEEQNEKQHEEENKNENENENATKKHQTVTTASVQLDIDIDEMMGDFFDDVDDEVEDKNAVESPP